MYAFVGQSLVISSGSAPGARAVCSRGSRATWRAVVDEDEINQGLKDAESRIDGNNKPKSTATFNYSFINLFAKKGPGSRPDWDLRPSKFRGQADCDMCRGTGGTVCAQCGGLGFFKEGEAVPCPSCGSKNEGKLECSTCYGSGKQANLDGEWWTGMAKFFR